MFGYCSMSQRILYLLLITFIAFAFSSPEQYKYHWITFGGLTFFLFVISKIIS